MKTSHIESLRAHGYKLTPKREAILDLFQKEDRYMSPEDLWKKLKRKFKTLGLPSIYRNLETFEQCGILVKVHREDRRLYYALCPSACGESHDHGDHHHHHHILCVECGKVDDVDECPIVDIKVGNYKVLRHSLQLEGLCPDCV